MSGNPDSSRSTKAKYYPNSREWIADWFLTSSSQTDIVDVVLEKSVLITLPMMKNVFPNGEDQRLQEIADELNSDLETYKLDTKLRLSHFFSQVREEAGPSAQINENLNYSESALKSIFSHFRRHPAEATLYGRTKDHSANQEAIANRAYANRNGNGSVESGDGWKYRGRGLKQLTGRGNYQDFRDSYGAYWSNSPDLMNNPDLLATPKYAARSAVFFWIKHGLYAIADQGHGAKQVDAITEVINKHTNSYDSRRQHFERIWDEGIFDEFGDGS